MQVKKTQDTPTSLTLTFVADEADLAAFKTAAVKQLGQNVKVAGFRPGKAPQAVIEKNIVDEAPGAFLLQTKQVVLLSLELQGVKFNAANFPVLTNAKWK